MENLTKGTYAGGSFSFPGKTHAGQYHYSAQSMGIVSEKEKIDIKKATASLAKLMVAFLIKVTIN